MALFRDEPQSPFRPSQRVLIRYNAQTIITKLKRMFWKTINERTNKYESEMKNVLERCKQKATKMTKKEKNE